MTTAGERVYNGPLDSYVVSYLTDADGNIVQRMADLALDTIVDETGAVSYYGAALPGTLTSAAKWKVIRKKTNAGVGSYRHAGTGAFDQIWNNRASLTYVDP